MESLLGSLNEFVAMNVQSICPHREHRMNIYKSIAGDRDVIFATGALSATIWGFSNRQAGQALKFLRGGFSE